MDTVKSTFYPNCLTNWLKKQNHAEAVDKVRYPVPFFAGMTDPVLNPFLWVPIFKHAVIISFKEYKPPYAPLNGVVETDVENMNLFFTKNGFSVSIMEDRSKEDIEKKFTELGAIAKKSDRKSVFFVYYTGRGSLGKNHGMTCAITNIGQLLRIEYLVRTLALRPNTSVFTILDCDREEYSL